MESQQSSAAAQAAQAAQARQRANDDAVSNAMDEWNLLCRSEQLAALKRLFETELETVHLLGVVQGLTAENQRLGAEIGALHVSLEKATAESVGHAQRVQLLSVALTECNRRIHEYEQQAASEEAGVDPPDDASAKKMSLAEAMQVEPDSYPQAEVVQALKLLQQAYDRLEGDMGEFVQSAQTQIRTLNEQIQTLQKQATTHAQPKQPQQAQQAGALPDNQEDECMTLEQAIKLVDYNLYSGDDVRKALKYCRTNSASCRTAKRRTAKRVLLHYRRRTSV